MAEENNNKKTPKFQKKFKFNLYWVQIGRASCRERVCQYDDVAVVADDIEKKRGQ